MLFSVLAALALCATSVNAHFLLLSPVPRGEFVEDNEVNFCGGYNDAVSNRSTFPLSGGSFSINTPHIGFTVGVLLSTEKDPNSWESFSMNGTQTFVRDYAKEEDAGTFCIPLDIAAAKIPGAVDGANVTIQVVFQGGDGNLYQCADLTLSSNLTAVSNASCTNTTTSSSSSTGGNSGVGQLEYLSTFATASALSLAGLAAAFL
ncbi:hypothetical protein DFP72DRAFT_12447 [Ephemerocybe angulata]|uniref:Copper acquisition factor BIM1-like domain-containing protein n=1 Tax=Ephemerocybe angulata TaxID=980116 RepID=A0A8H6IKN1_9AGAR|nr:hypothetical protein DFP72DRAFT_12447 [Tulosesus angulatus]